MNKWENSSHKNECFCANKQGLFIPNRQLSCMLAFFLFLLFFVFMTGYFLGKKTFVQQVSDQIQQEAFADQVYTSLIAQSPHSELSENSISIVQNNDTLPVEESSLQAHSSLNDENNIENIPTIDNIESKTFYYAQLIGFATEKAAQLFVNKLAAKGIETEIKKHSSKTAKGKISYWYQVITTAYSNKDELIQLVDKITKEENIKDAHIRVC